MRTSVKIAAISVVAGLAKAQTFSECNPVAGDTCPANPAFSGDAEFDFASASGVSDLDSFFIVDDGIRFDEGRLQFNSDTGMEMIIAAEEHAPTLISDNYVFFGRVEVELQAAPGAGIVTSVVLQSDSLDEIDWEFIGNDVNHVQTNFFSHGVEDYTNGGMHEVPFNPTTSFHTYAIDWNPDRMLFFIDGQLIREALASDGSFPQTPCQLRIGTWVGGKGDEQGTIDWAGGLADFTNGPFSGYYRRVSVVDYAGGYDSAEEYEYTNTDGTWQSIRVVGAGNQVGFPDSDASPPPSDGHQEDNDNEDEEEEEEETDSSPSPAESTPASTTSTTSSSTSTTTSTTSSTTTTAALMVSSGVSSAPSTLVEVTSSLEVPSETSSAVPSASESSTSVPEGSEDEEDVDVGENAGSQLRQGGLFVSLAAVAAVAWLL